MSRLLGLDIGEKRIGIAVSDAMGWIATPHSVYLRVGYGPDVAHPAVDAAVGADSVVVGLPRNMDGSLGLRP